MKRIRTVFGSLAILFVALVMATSVAAATPLQPAVGTDSAHSSPGGAGGGTDVIDDGSLECDLQGDPDGGLHWDHGLIGDWIDDGLVPQSWATSTSIVTVEGILHLFIVMNFPAP